MYNIDCLVSKLIVSVIPGVIVIARKHPTFNPPTQKLDFALRHVTEYSYS